MTDATLKIAPTGPPARRRIARAVLRGLLYLLLVLFVAY